MLGLLMLWRLSSLGATKLRQLIYYQPRNLYWTTLSPELLFLLHGQTLHFPLAMYPSCSPLHSWHHLDPAWLDSFLQAFSSSWLLLLVGYFFFSPILYFFCLWKVTKKLLWYYRRHFWGIRCLPLKINIEFANKNTIEFKPRQYLSLNGKQAVLNQHKSFTAISTWQLSTSRLPNHLQGRIFEYTYPEGAVYAPALRWATCEQRNHQLLYKWNLSPPVTTGHTAAGPGALGSCRAALPS